MPISTRTSDIYISNSVKVMLDFIDLGRSFEFKAFNMLKLYESMKFETLCFYKPTEGSLCMQCIHFPPPPLFCLICQPQSTRKFLMGNMEMYKPKLKNHLSFCWSRDSQFPTGSMYSIFTYIWLIFMV